jgi:hypothetical protein
LFVSTIVVDELFHIDCGRAYAHRWVICLYSSLSSVVIIHLFRSKSPLDKSLVTLHGFSDSQEILLAVTMETDFADVLSSRFESVYGNESLASLCIVALYLDMIHLRLSEDDIGILKNVVSNFNLFVAEKMFSNRVSIRIKEVMVLFDGLFGMPAASWVSGSSQKLQVVPDLDLQEVLITERENTMTPCFVISADISIGQEQTAKTLALLIVFRIKTVASSFEQTSEHKLARACLVTS